MVIGMDFDHTLVNGDQALPGARHAINCLREQGHRIIIHSCNNPKWIKKVLLNNDTRYDSIWTKTGKPICDLYVDDRGYMFKGDWDKELPILFTYLELRNK